MAVQLIRSIGKNAASVGNILGKEVFLSTRAQNVSAVQVAYLRATYGAPFGYEEPYDYKNKKLNIITEWFDKTMPRMNENSKIILVDGNIAIGKNDFGSRLAKNLDMRFYPSVAPERAFIQHDYGFDLTKLNDLVPESARFYNLDDLYTAKDLKNGRIGKMLIYWFRASVHNYCTACLHLLSTGQGVVLANSCFSDVVYMDAMHKMGYISPNWHNYIELFYREVVCELLPPHVSIHLTAPIETLRQRINKRGKPSEINSKALTDNYLKAIEKNLKNRFTSQMRLVSETLDIDWTEVASDHDMEVLAEEMEGLVLENIDNEDPKFRDWRHYTEDDLARYRRIFQNGEAVDELFMRALPTDCPEILINDDDAFAYQSSYFEHPAVKYRPGYAPELGHNPIFKLK